MKDKNEIGDFDIKDVDVISAPVAKACHRSLKERAEEYGGELLISEEIEREVPIGNEVW